MRELRGLFQQTKESGWELSMRNQSNQYPIIQKLFSNNGLTLVITCPACPEQYDVFKGDKQVAYFRLRHGVFTVDYPDVEGDEIYYAEPKGNGIFDKDERLNYMAKAMRVVLNKINE